MSFESPSRASIYFVVLTCLWSALEIRRVSSQQPDAAAVEVDLQPGEETRTEFETTRGVKGRHPAGKTLWRRQPGQRPFRVAPQACDQPGS